MFTERVTVEDLESQHVQCQLVERLSWAVGDAAAVEHDPSAEFYADDDGDNWDDKPHEPARDMRAPALQREPSPEHEARLSVAGPISRD